MLKILIASLMLLIHITQCNETNPQVEYKYTHDTTFITSVDTLIQIDTVYIDEIMEPEFIEVKPAFIKVDSVHPVFPPENMIDNIPYKSRSEKGTRYAVPNYPRCIIFDFEEITEIKKIAINTFGWDEGYTHNFIIYNFSDTLAIFETKPEIYSAHKINFVGRRLTIKVEGGKNSWTDIGEVKFYAKDTK